MMVPDCDAMVNCGFRAVVSDCFTGLALTDEMRDW